MSTATTEHLATASVPTIIATGLLLGVVHVITGPDHLSALIVLSAGSSWRSCQLGMRWGCGHSVGLIVVTAIFLAVNKQFDVDKFGTYCDFFVGLLMITLGCWSFAYYWKMRPGNDGTKESDAAVLQAEAQAHVDAHLNELRPRDGGETQPLLHAHEHPSSPSGGAWCCGLFETPSVDIKDAKTQRVTAFMYGIAHGLAGTGGILGVLPAVILNDWIKSWAYLLSFCVASIFIMGVFAATYGEVTGRIVRMSDQLLFRVGIFSSCVSLVVGVMWVILVSTGKLDEVFG
ncbi:hypothetical protein Poli38472_013584 [Pythium oligandrum]|uniref:Uncharacterized protein n=1 Tax=Pythium oligandrum TaxID=41045 RepID=A0A8K1CDZ1_PYTOL|nr:hypothetical protein Poli38472_013584 [Pythium oligandrum]|eukprot:TMW61121.1 hypothetical protein Poli38472_013584 [Pythium oligandrum]